jgi:hypothetical protein
MVSSVSSPDANLARPGRAARPLALGLATILFVAIVVGLHFVCLHFYAKADRDPWDLSDFWPLSVFTFRRPLAPQVGIAALLVVIYAAAVRRALARPIRLVEACLWAFGLVVVSNLLHGVQLGLDYPTASWGEGGIEYYHDAVALRGHGVAWFLRRFHDLQPVLLEHASTHPPGPVILYYALLRLAPNPIAISLGVALLAVTLSITFWCRLLRLALGADANANLGGLSLLFALVPGVLIYYLAVVDAVIAGVFLAALVLFLEPGLRKLALCVLFLWLGSLLTFGFLFLLPVLAGLELLHRRRLWLARLAAVGAGLVALHGLLYVAFGFNYARAFAVASRLENEGGFLLLADPRGYFWYRLGAVLEIAFFFTPVLLWVALAGLPSLRARAPRLAPLAWLGPSTVLLMLLAGVMKVGEAARICLFLVPYLLLPVAAWWTAPDVSNADRRRVLHSVFACGLAMQLFGFYQW